MYESGFEIVALTRLDEPGDAHARCRCLTCSANVRRARAWSVVYRIGGESGRDFDGTVCGRCARKLLVVLQAPSGNG